MGTATLEPQTSSLDALIAAAESQAGKPSPWSSLRARGLAAHKALGLPTAKDEAWKYTPIRPLLAQRFELGATQEVTLPARWRADSFRIVLVNGVLARDLSDQDTPAGLTISDSGDLGSIARIEEHTFAALATALIEAPLVVKIASGAEVDRLIEVVHVATGAGKSSAPRVAIVAGAGSVATVVETYATSGPGPTLTLPVTEATIQEGARLEHIKVQIESDEAFHIGLWEARQEAGSEYKAYNIAFGGKLARTDQGIYIAGENAVTRLDGVVVANGEQLLDNHTRLDHAVPNCNSFEIYKQIVDGHATVVFNGQIYVHQDAQKTDAKQTNQALLLSPNATINSKPQLEIFADDVKCTHGATVGQLEDLPLFYMRSRGLPKETAESMLVYAFAAEVLELISDDEVKRSLERLLFTKLGGSEPPA